MVSQYIRSQSLEVSFTTTKKLWQFGLNINLKNSIMAPETCSQIQAKDVACFLNNVDSIMELETCS